MLLEKVPYFKEGEPKREAVILKVDFDTTCLPEEDVNVLGHLSEAVNGMNPIYQDQTEPKTPVVREVVERLVYAAQNPDHRRSLAEYLTILDLQNGPFDDDTEKNHRLQAKERKVRELVRGAKDRKLRNLFEETVPFLFAPLRSSDKANFYPHCMTNADFEGLGEDKFLVNSRVVQVNGGGLRVVRNEETYRETLGPVIESLKRAHEITTNPGFKEYLAAKIKELQTGSKEDRREADLSWIRNSHSLDLILSTGLEVYADRWKGIRGEAAGAVMVVAREFEVLLEIFRRQVTEWERQAPWILKKDSIDPSTLPKIKSVNVLNWGGGYVGQQTTVAQSLPNDDDLREQYGAVNLVYKNVGEAVFAASGIRWYAEFFPEAVVGELQELFPEAETRHFALHELGHSTGRLHRMLEGRKANDVLGDEYSSLEECRAELFGIFALPSLVREGVITEEQMRAGYYGLVKAAVASLKFEPRQAHTKARNMIYHFFREQGVIDTIEEGGKTKFTINLDRIAGITAKMLGELGNIRSYGHRPRAKAFRERYCFDDPIRAEVDKRTADYPVGRGLMFPTLVREGDRFTNSLVYSTNFSNQPRYTHTLRS